jgi:hypothetical protein
MSRGLRMDLEIYRAFKQNIPSLDAPATRMTIQEHTTPTTMKNRILHVASELSIPVTVRKVPGGLLFWRSISEDLQHATDVAQRVQTAQRPDRSRPGRRRRL